MRVNLEQLRQKLSDEVYVLSAMEVRLPSIDGEINAQLDGLTNVMLLGIWVQTVHIFDDAGFEGTNGKILESNA